MRFRRSTRRGSFRPRGRTSRGRGRSRGRRSFSSRSPRSGIRVGFRM